MYIHLKIWEPVWNYLSLVIYNENELKKKDK